MNAVVIDTSVVVKWYIPEQHHVQARALRDAYLEGSVGLVAPALMPFETVNALKYSGHYEGTRLEEASKSLQKYGIELIPFSNTGPVATVANRLETTVYDAAYIALAQKLETTVYTADEKLLEMLDGEYAESAAHIRTYSSE